jgi:serine/threonine-protein kinase
MEGRNFADLDIMEVTLASRRVRELIHVQDFWDAGGVISPDGRWLAYESEASGQTNVYVCSYPDVTKACAPVSTGGGDAPRWLPKTGSELFYVTFAGAVMRVKMDFTGATPQPGPAAKVLDLKGFVGFSYGVYDIAPDGRFVVIQRDLPSSEMTVVLNWNQELARLTSGK